MAAALSGTALLSSLLIPVRLVSLSASRFGGAGWMAWPYLPLEHTPTAWRFAWAIGAAEPQPSGTALVSYVDWAALTLQALAALLAGWVLTMLFVLHPRAPRPGRAFWWFLAVAACVVLMLSARFAPSRYWQRSGYGTYRSEISQWHPDAQLMRTRWQARAHPTRTSNGTVIGEWRGEWRVLMLEALALAFLAALLGVAANRRRRTLHSPCV